MSTVQQLFDLSGKVAIVTGAGTGLGVTFAGALAEAGAAVVCAGIDLEPVEQTATVLRERGSASLALAVDVTDEAAVTAMMAGTTERFGRLDILVRAMIAAGSGGRIINIASILGAVASEPMPAAAYAASKGAVVNLTRDLAVHWAPHGILVNAIGPAYFPSEMTRGAFANPEIVAAIERRTPLGRLGELDDLKGPVVFLASAAAAYVTGQTLYVDGGWTAW